MAGIPVDAKPRAPLTRHDVEIAYRLLRGARPEPAEADRLLERSATLDELRRTLVKEAGPKLHKLFQDHGGGAKALRAGRMRVDVDVPGRALENLLAHVEEVWRGFGERDPYWSVLTKFKSGGDAFYETGRKRIEFFAAALDRAGIDIAALGDCFELGCGVGRLTVWLAERFAHVTAADISSSHLALARQAARERGRSNVDFVRVATPGELAGVAPFDAFFSVISLQHSPPPVIKYVLEMLLGRLKPGGVAYFQLPTFIPEREFDAGAYLADLDAHRGMETFALPQKVLFALFDKLGLSLLEIREDDQCGPKILSNTFLVQRR